MDIFYLHRIDATAMGASQKERKGEEEEEEEERKDASLDQE